MKKLQKIIIPVALSAGIVMPVAATLTSCSTTNNNESDVFTKEKINLSVDAWAEKSYTDIAKLCGIYNESVSATVSNNDSAIASYLVENLSTNAEFMRFLIISDMYSYATLCNTFKQETYSKDWKNARLEVSFDKLEAANTSSGFDIQFNYLQNNLPSTVDGKYAGYKYGSVSINQMFSTTNQPFKATGVEITSQEYHYIVHGSSVSIDYWTFAFSSPVVSEFSGSINYLSNAAYDKNFLSKEESLNHSFEDIIKGIYPNIQLS